MVQSFGPSSLNAMAPVPTQIMTKSQTPKQHDENKAQGRRAIASPMTMDTLFEKTASSTMLELAPTVMSPALSASPPISMSLDKTRDAK
eukprot:CAMPEP_0115707254 /NCGR_PEP_ID=MMETSP0272-20121206/71250_1 /TAXON_ID=71861 /ORGANISM="Scrippsiella trochoidea, Strain CCMP3099" /LENGTH=88 /DNA_ID=CAMNT_0003148605 /DNA_START=127 /DNA_END=391 /DNA_ORIENTATION=-